MIKHTVTYEAITISVVEDAAVDAVALATRIQMRVDEYIARYGGDVDLATAASESSVLRAELDAFLNGVQRIAGDSVNRAWRSAYAEELNTRHDVEERFAWRVESGNPCPDCVSRNGRVETLYEWNLLGLPKSGWSICGANCHCTLQKA